MAYGEFDSVLETLEFDTTYVSSFVQPVVVRDGIIVLFYTAWVGGNNSIGMLATIGYNTSSATGLSVLDSLLVHNTCKMHTICVVTTGVVAIAYNNTTASANPVLSTYSVDADGNISLIDSTNYGFTCWQVDNDIHLYKCDHTSNQFILAFDALVSGNCDLKLYSIPIADNGTIGATSDTWAFGSHGSSNYWVPRICNWSGSVYAMVHQINSSSYTSIVTTFGMSGASFSGTVDSFDLSAYSYKYRAATIAQPQDGIMAIAFYDSSLAVNDGWLYTVACDSSGTFGSLLDTLKFQDSQCTAPEIFTLATGVVMIGIAFLPSGGALRAYSYSIGDDGTINGTMIDWLQVSSIIYGRAQIVHISEDFWAIAYAGTSVDGYIATYGVSTYNEDVVAENLITSIIHRYDRNKRIYQTECVIGGVTSDFGFPDWSNEPAIYTEDPNKYLQDNIDALRKVIDTVTDPLSDFFQNMWNLFFNRSAAPADVNEILPQQTFPGVDVVAPTVAEFKEVVSQKGFLGTYKAPPAFTNTDATDQWLASSISGGNYRAASQKYGYTADEIKQLLTVMGPEQAIQYMKSTRK